MISWQLFTSRKWMICGSMQLSSPSPQRYLARRKSSVPHGRAHEAHTQRQCTPYPLSEKTQLWLPALNTTAMQVSLAQRGKSQCREMEASGDVTTRSHQKQACPQERSGVLRRGGIQGQFDESSATRALVHSNWHHRRRLDRSQTIAANWCAIFQLTYHYIASMQMRLVNIFEYNWQTGVSYI